MVSLSLSHYIKNSSQNQEYHVIVYVIRYVPGNPGAPWSHQEVIVVKSKLYSIFGKGGGKDALEQIYDGENPSTWEDVPDAPKMLRLGFHDCLKYTDGSGGCDGCLNWEGQHDHSCGIS